MSCPDCFRGSVHTHATPTGTMTTLHGISTYVAGGADPARSKSTIIYLSDAFSLKLVNNKLLADQYAAATGSRVLIPDVVRNGGMPAHVLDGMNYLTYPIEGWKVVGLAGKFFTALTLLPHLVPFLLFGHPKNAYPSILAYARAVRAELPPGGKIGVAGFCWGGWPATKLCVETAVPGGSERLIDAQFNGHPSFIAETPEMVVDAIKTFKVPYAMAVAELDFQFDKDVADKTEATVREAIGESGGPSGGVYEFRLYKGCRHGFCVKAAESQMAGYHDAVKQATDWFSKYLA